MSVQAAILNLLAELRRDLGLTLLFISHDISVVRHMADDVLVMYCGRPAEQGSRADVLDRPLHPYTRMLLAATPFVDPARRVVSVPVRGELPSPLDPPLGCAFASRCPHAQARCTAERPALRLVDGRLVACHFAEAVAAIPLATAAA